MKRVVCVLMIAVAMILCLCACGNENWGVGNYTYRHVHVGDGVAGYCATVKSWHNDSMGIELHTDEFGDVYCSEGTYLLFRSSEDCPFCAG